MGRGLLNCLDEKVRCVERERIRLKSCVGRVELRKSYSGGGGDVRFCFAER